MHMGQVKMEASWDSQSVHIRREQVRPVELSKVGLGAGAFDFASHNVARRIPAGTRTGL